MKWAYTKFKSGDIIRVKVGSVYHYGICSDDMKVIAFGLPPTQENFKNSGDVKVICTDMDVFSAGGEVETAQLSFTEKIRRRNPQKTVELAKSCIGEGGYDLIHNNCEHFVNYVVFGVKESTQEQEARKKWQEFEKKHSQKT